MNKKTNEFLLKSTLLFSITWGMIELLFDFNPYQKNDLETSYNAAIIDKYARLEKLKSPKIVLIAGSNFAYGINSEMIEKAFKQPVVNMAMHYDFGTDFMLRQIEPELRKGDTVIMGFEYIVESKGDMKEKLLTAKLFPKANDWITYKDIFEYVGANAKVRISTFRLTLERAFSQNKTEATMEDTTNVFFRKAINKYGDLESHFNNPPLKKIKLSELNGNISLEPLIDDMNIFYEKMNKIGVKVYFVYPSYAQSNYLEHKSTITKMQNELEKGGKFPILGKAIDFVYPDSLCHDMVYHLNVKGRDIRTQQIIDLLSNSN